MDQQLIYCITVMSPALNTNVDKPQKKKHRIGRGANKLWLLGALEFNDFT